MLTVGTSPVHQKLHLLDQHGNFVVEMADESAPLRVFKPQDGWRIHVHDTDPFRTVERYQDVSSGPKYIMTDKEYHERKGTFREWKLANPDEYMKHFGHLHAGKRGEEDGKEQADGVEIGSRCRLIGDRRGEVVWIGPPDFAKGWWVGIKLDEPSGKNDGTVKGKRYFTCDDKFGIFVKAEEIETGDFPPLGLTFDSDDEI
jgi:tubulin-specific chaperone B